MPSSVDTLEHHLTEYRGECYQLWWTIYQRSPADAAQQTIRTVRAWRALQQSAERLTTESLTEN